MTLSELGAREGCRGRVQAARAAGMRVVGFTGGGHWGHDRAGRDLLDAGAAAIFENIVRPVVQQRSGQPVVGDVRRNGDVADDVRRRWRPVHV